MGSLRFAIIAVYDGLIKLFKTDYKNCLRWSKTVVSDDNDD